MQGLVQIWVCPHPLLHKAPSHDLGVQRLCRLDVDNTDALSGLLRRFFEDAYALVQKGRLDGWYPDADLYELLIAWMCTQEDLVDTAEQLVRQELLVCHTLTM